MLEEPVGHPNLSLSAPHTWVLLWAAHQPLLSHRQDRGGAGGGENLGCLVPLGEKRGEDCANRRETLQPEHPRVPGPQLHGKWDKTPKYNIVSSFLPHPTWRK